MDSSLRLDALHKGPADPRGMQQQLVKDFCPSPSVCKPSLSQHEGWAGTEHGDSCHHLRHLRHLRHLSHLRSKLSELSGP